MARDLLRRQSVPDTDNRRIASTSAVRKPVPEDLLDPALVPVAGQTDTQRTIEVLLPYFREHGGSVVVVHVVTRQPNWPDPVPPSIRASAAERMFETVINAFTDAGVEVETRLLEGQKVSKTILSAAADVDAASIAVVRRGGNWLVRLLSGNVGCGILKRSERPVLMFVPGEGASVVAHSP